MQILVPRLAAQNFVQVLRSMAPYGCGSNPWFGTMHSRVGNLCPGILHPIIVLLTRSPLSTPIAQSISGAAGTIFVKDLLHRVEGTTVSRVIRRCQQAVYRIWLKGMTGTYPTHAYLKRVGLVNSPDYQYCNAGVPETLTHFVCVCPQFREALTSAHNPVLQVVSSFLTRCVGPKWTVYGQCKKR